MRLALVSPPRLSTSLPRLAGDGSSRSTINPESGNELVIHWWMEFEDTRIDSNRSGDSKIDPNSAGSLTFARVCDTSRDLVRLGLDLRSVFYRSKRKDSTIVPFLKNVNQLSRVIRTGYLFESFNVFF